LQVSRGAGSCSKGTLSPRVVVGSSYRWQPETMYRRSTRTGDLPELRVDQRRRSAFLRGDNGLKKGGAELTKTAVAGPVVLSVKPSISPVTVPGTVPNVLLKEKSKLSAWPGVGASANAHANANAPKVSYFS
jgi:hypothetical protein